MSSNSLSAPVGRSPRTGEGDPVQNRSDDVKLVRAMLLANGMPSNDSGSVDSGLLKLIEVMQKRAGVRPIDYVVDPGGLTEKKMRPAYDKMIKELGTGDCFRIDYKGKKILISKADKEQIEKATLDHLGKYIDIIGKSQEHNAKIVQEWMDAVDGTQGFLKAISFILVASVATLKSNLPTLSKNFGAAKEAAKAAHKAKDIKALTKTIPAMEKASNALTDEMLRFLKQIGASAKNMHGALKLTTSVGWAIVGAMATPVLVSAGAGMATATVIGSAGTALLSTGANELGRHAIGQKVTMGESLRNIIVDMIVGAAVGKAGSLKPAFVKNIAKSLTPGLAALLEGYVAKEVAEKFIERYLTNTVQSAALGIVTDILDVAKETIKKGGKCPSEKELKDKITKRIKETLLAGPFGEMGRFQKAWVHKKKPDLITKKLVPDTLKSSKFKNAELTDRQQRDLCAKVADAMTKSGTTKVIDKVIDKVSGKPTESQLLKSAETTLLSDSKIKAEVEKLIDAELKKMKVPA